MRYNGSIIPIYTDQPKTIQDNSNRIFLFESMGIVKLYRPLFLNRVK
jgi:hypothetical protein